MRQEELKIARMTRAQSLYASEVFKKLIEEKMKSQQTNGEISPVSMFSNIQ